MCLQGSTVFCVKRHSKRLQLIQLLDIDLFKDQFSLKAGLDLTSEDLKILGTLVDLVIGFRKTGHHTVID